METYRFSWGDIIVHAQTSKFDAQGKLQATHKTGKHFSLTTLISFRLCFPQFSFFWPLGEHQRNSPHSYEHTLLIELPHQTICYEGLNVQLIGERKISQHLPR